MVKAPSGKLVLFVGLALLAFAGNSLLARAALADGGIQAEAFAGIRLISGALMLSGICVWQKLAMAPRVADLPGTMALVVYAAAFSAAYVAMGAATGALVLFASVQFAMVGSTLLKGGRVHPVQYGGLLLALAGLVWLLWPGLARPPMKAFGLMIVAGVAWGIYSILGRGEREPLARTARNFIGTVPVAVVLILFSGWQADRRDVALAIASGAVTSGLGYAVWYSALPQLSIIAAGSLQLAVPVITAAGSLWLLGETISLAFVGASLLILMGIAMTLWR